MSPKRIPGPLFSPPPEVSAALFTRPSTGERGEALGQASGLRHAAAARAPRRRHPALAWWAGVLLVLLLALPGATPAWAGLDDDRYDGNIFALYAGNGSLVPPRSTLADARAAGRVAVVVYYLDDSSVSKRFAPVVSELQRQWGNSIELIPLVTDPLQDRQTEGADDPATYWKGTIPQVVVFDRAGKVVFDASGAVGSDAINTAVSRATGIPLAAGSSALTTESFNELNAEVVPSRP
jgi:hypothetical protein